MSSLTPPQAFTCECCCAAPAPADLLETVVLVRRVTLALVASSRDSSTSNVSLTLLRSPASFRACEVAPSFASLFQFNSLTILQPRHDSFPTCACEPSWKPACAEAWCLRMISLPCTRATSFRTRLRRDLRVTQRCALACSQREILFVQRFSLTRISAMRCL